MCFTCARNIVVQHKINFWVDVEHTVCFPCVWLCFISVSFKNTHIDIGFVFLLWVYVVIEHMVSSKLLQISISWTRKFPQHYNDVIMSMMASQITNLTIVYLSVYSGADQRTIKTPRHWPLWGEFTGDRWIPRTKGRWRGKYFHLVTSSWHMLGCWALSGLYARRPLPTVNLP